MKLSGILKLSVLLLGILLLSGCGSSVGLELRADFETIAQDATSPFSNIQAHVQILRSEEELGTLWQQIHGGESAPPPVPQVSFPDKMVIVLVDSARPTGGYAIAITAVTPTEQGIFVTAVQTSPGPTCVVTQALTQPYHIVTVPWLPGNPSLTLASVIRDCGS